MPVSATVVRGALPTEARGEVPKTVTVLFCDLTGSTAGSAVRL
jgi:class 3 adenylate cyclase